jgi:hypothetical protein
MSGLNVWRTDGTCFVASSACPAENQQRPSAVLRSVSRAWHSGFALTIPRIEIVLRSTLATLSVNDTDDKAVDQANESGAAVR